MQNMNSSDFILKLKQTWNIRLLTFNDVDEMTHFLGLFNEFFQLCEGENGSSLGILNACPPSKDIHKDKVVLGLYDNDTLIGLLDIIRNYPEDEIWTIGYLLIHPEYRNQGLGSKFIKNLGKILTPSKLICVVQKQNRRALTFWESNGFKIITEKKEKLGQLINTTFILENRWKLQS